MLTNEERQEVVAYVENFAEENGGGTFGFGWGELLADVETERKALNESVGKEHSVREVVEYISYSSKAFTFYGMYFRD